MGGRGSTSASSKSNPTASAIHVQTQQTQQTQQAQPTLAQTQAQWGNQAPTAPMQTSLAQIAQMDDTELLSLMQASRGVDMPNHLKDSPSFVQEFVYNAGLNDLPEVYDAQGFKQFLQDNNIKSADIMARVVGANAYTTTAGTRRKLSALQIHQMLATDPYNYIGGKKGGQALGAGAYFETNGGKNTGYGSGQTAQMNAVLNPKTARPINMYSQQWATGWNRWSATHPQSAHFINRLNHGDKLSMQALVQGYNVITDGTGHGTYNNIIIRNAMAVQL